MTDFFKTEMNCLGPAPQKDKGAVKSTEKCLLLVDISYVNVYKNSFFCLQNKLCWLLFTYNIVLISNNFLYIFLNTKHYKCIFCLLNNIEKNIEEKKLVVVLQIFYGCQHLFLIFHCCILHRFGYRLNENFQSQKFQNQTFQCQTFQSQTSLILLDSGFFVCNSTKFCAAVFSREIS